LQISRLQNLSKISEEPKPCTVANNEENQVKNRSESVIPFDRNRVILAPISSREGSAYINASFIDVSTSEKLKLNLKSN
jgi:protein-tyrosine phosphatase